MTLTLKEKIDNSEFKEWYLKIKSKFNFDYHMDCEARDYLSELLKKKTDYPNLETILSSFKTHIQQKNIILIYGCGPSLEETVDLILMEGCEDFFNKSFNLAADGASILLKEKEIIIDGIFSDLDGITRDLFNNSKFIIIHAHGNNIERIKYFESEILKFKNIIGTTQVEPTDNLLNPGGFTDGDRILFFIKSFLLPHHKLFLIGMDFGKIVGKYSKPKMVKNQEGNPIKLKKLQFAVKLIEGLKIEVENEIYFVNSEIVSSEFNYISLKDFKKIILER